MITSTGNAQVKNLILLQKKSRERKKQGLFVAEGRKMCAEAPSGWIEGIFVSETFAANENMEDISRGIKYEVLSDSVFAHVSDTQTPQGILCVLKCPSYSLADMMQVNDPVFLVLEGIQDPGNLGTMIRTGEGAGISGVIMDRNTVDIFNPKVIRSTMGSIYRVPFFVADDLGDTIRSLKKTDISIYAAHLKGRLNYTDIDYSGACAFLIGNEGNGLSDETAALADTYVRIPMEGKVESLNAAVSAALFMYEAHNRRMSTE